LTPRGARTVCESSFSASGEDLFGIEAEWPVHGNVDVAERPSPAVMSELSGLHTPSASRVTFEPGGQVELSTAPMRSIGDALVALAEDTSYIRGALASAGYSLSEQALDARPPRRVLDTARYAAMEGFFAVRGTSGSWMMNNTASTQVNLSHDTTDPARRWSTINHIAPVLIAAFANSPGVDENGQRCASLRQVIWWGVDPGRTRPVRLDLPPCAAWSEYALNADVAFICADGSTGESGLGLLPGFSFGRWMQEGHELGWPTEDDLRYHLSMLFPPVRARGWLEVRVLDALPSWIRAVACLVVAAAATPEADQELRAVLPETNDLWLAASRSGVRYPRLGRAADVLFTVAQRNLGLVSSDGDHEAMLAYFIDRFLHRRRMPGDECARPVDLRAPARPNAFALTSSLVGVNGGRRRPESRTGPRTP
jgi:glutamate--cysteine ligase